MSATTAGTEASPTSGTAARRAPRVALFATCFNDTMWPEAPRATVTLLERLGCEVDAWETTYLHRLMANHLPENHRSAAVLRSSASTSIDRRSAILRNSSRTFIKGCRAPACC